MFDIGWTELLVVAAVALIVVGPRELPGMLRTIGRMMAGVRRMASDFQSQFNEAMREAELDELRKEVEGLRRTATGLLDVGSDPLSTARDSLKSAIEGKPAETPAAVAAGDEPSILPPPASPVPGEPAATPPAAVGAPTADGVEALRAFPPIEHPPAPEPGPPAELAPAPAEPPRQEVARP